MIQKKNNLYYGLIFLFFIALLIIPSSGIMGSGVNTEINNIDNIQLAVFQNSTSGYLDAEVQFNITFGSSYTDRFETVIETSDGNYILIGKAYAYSANCDTWIEKVDNTGTQLWNSTYGGIDDEGLYAVDAIETSDGGILIVCDTFSYDTSLSPRILLVKINNTGGEEWSKDYGKNNSVQIGYSVIETSDNHYLICGTNGTSLNTGDVWLIKVNQNDGTVDWDETYGGAADEDVRSVIETSSGNYLVTGTTKSYGNPSISDIWVFSVDSSGTMQLNRTFGGLQYDSGYDSIQTSDGGFLIASRSYSYNHSGNSLDSDIYLIKTNVALNPQWTKNYGGIGAEGPYSVIETSNGSYVCAGFTTTDDAGEGDAFLIAVDSNGVPQWNFTAGGTHEDGAHSLIQTSDGSYLFAGYTENYGGATFDSSLGWAIKIKISKEDLDDCPENPLPFDLDPYAIFLALLALLGLNALQILIFLLRRK